jgi:amino acid transporter
VRSERRLPAGLCAAVLCAALALASAAGAAGAPTPQNASPRPNPQKLWKHYPLNPKPSGSSERSQSAAGAIASSGGHSVILALVWITCLVVGLGWMISVARLIRRPERSDAAGRSTVSADDLSDALIGAVRRVTRTARRARKSRH